MRVLFIRMLWVIINVCFVSDTPFVRCTDAWCKWVITYPYSAPRSVSKEYYCTSIIYSLTYLLTNLTLRAGFWINFVRSWQKWYAPIITTILFVALFIDRYYDGLLPLLRQFLLIPNRNDNLWILERIVLPSALINSAGIWSIPDNLWLFSFSIANSTPEALGSGTSGSAVCIAVYLT
jgi:hypothetical protein